MLNSLKEILIITKAVRSRLLLVFTCHLSVNAQNVTYKSFGDGLRVMAEDSTFSLKMGVRFQTLFLGALNLDTDNWNDRFLVRRARLKFDEFALSPKLQYKFQWASPIGILVEDKIIKVVLPWTRVWK